METLQEIFGILILFYFTNTTRVARLSVVYKLYSFLYTSSTHVTICQISKTKTVVLSNIEIDRSSILGQSKICLHTQVCLAMAFL